MGATLRVYAVPSYATQAIARVVAINKITDAGMKADANKIIADSFKYQARDLGDLNDVTFERIVYEVNATMDTWWWEGASWQDVTYRNNTFRDSPYGGAGVAALRVGPSVTAGTATDVFSNVLIEGNRFETPGGDAANQANNAAHATIRGNLILSPGARGIKVDAVSDGTVENNTVYGGKAANILIENHSDGVHADSNTFCNTGLDPATVVAAVGSSNISMVANTIKTDCDAARSPPSIPAAAKPATAWLRAPRRECIWPGSPAEANRSKPGFTWGCRRGGFLPSLPRGDFSFSERFVHGPACRMANCGSFRALPAYLWVGIFACRVRRGNRNEMA